MAIKRFGLVLLIGLLTGLQGCTWLAQFSGQSSKTESKQRPEQSLAAFVAETNRQYAKPSVSSSEWRGHISLPASVAGDRQLEEQLQRQGLLISPYSLLIEAHKERKAHSLNIDKSQGILMPVLTLTKDGYLIPDVEQTEQLYRWLKDETSLQIKSAGSSLKLYRAFVAAVAHNCPRPPNNPSPVCQFQSWIGWDQMKSAALGQVYVEKRFQEQLKKWPEVGYIIWPQMSIYMGQTAALMKYAPSSEPLVNLTFEQRRERLGAIDGNARLDFIPVVKSAPEPSRGWCQASPLLIGAAKASGRPVPDIEDRLKLMKQGFRAIKSFCGQTVTDFDL
ncbi:hypothetical protein ACWJJH_16355 [Endozoicomonadaceae bacterium StTr2]